MSCWVVFSTISCLFVSLSSVVFVRIWIDVHTPLSCNRGSVYGLLFRVAFRLWISRSVRFGAMAEFVLLGAFVDFFPPVLSLNALLSPFLFQPQNLSYCWLLSDSSFGFTYTFLFGSCIVCISFLLTFSTLSLRDPDFWTRHIFSML